MAELQAEFSAKLRTVIGRREFRGDDEAASAFTMTFEVPDATKAHVHSFLEGQPLRLWKQDAEHSPLVPAMIVRAPGKFEELELRVSQCVGANEQVCAVRDVTLDKLVIEAVAGERARVTGRLRGDLPRGIYDALLENVQTTVRIAVSSVQGELDLDGDGAGGADGASS